MFRVWEVLCVFLVTKRVGNWKCIGGFVWRMINKVRSSKDLDGCKKIVAEN